MSRESEFFIMLIETYAAYRQLKGSEVIALFEKNNLIPYIYEMYELYHIEALQNAYDDLDERMGLSPMT